MKSVSLLTRDIINIHPIIKNKYVSYDELDELIVNLDSLLKLSIQSKHSMLTEPNYGLDVIFPAINHLQLFLDEEDLGTIALISKTLYNLMVLNFTSIRTEIYIIKHYIKHYKYNVNIDFNINEKILSVPIPVNIVKLKQLRNLIGCEEYFKKHIFIFSKLDLLYIVFNKNEPINKSYCVCVFCEKFILDHDKHERCKMDFYDNSLIKYPNDIISHGAYIPTYKIDYIRPDLEHLIRQTKQQMPPRMRRCNGKFDTKYRGHKPNDNDLCNLCYMQHVFHTLSYES